MNMVSGSPQGDKIASMREPTPQTSEDASLWSHVSLGTDEMHNSFRSEGTGLGSIPLQPGELEAAEHERPTSAPPPGFSHPGADERNRMAEELLWGPQLLSEINASDGALKVKAQTTADRNSFTNLAAVLGAGLAESMENPSENSKPVAGLFAKDDLNFHRQTRHAASRLVGAAAAPAPSDPFSSKLNPSASLFSSFSPAPAGSRGFPTSLSTPTRKRESEAERIEQQREALRGSTTPVDMLAGQGKPGQRRNLPVSKDIGTNVVEPEGENQFGGLAGIVSQRHDTYSSTPYESSAVAGGDNVSLPIQGDFDHFWSPLAAEFKPASMQQVHENGSDGNSSISDSVGAHTEISTQQAEAELKLFLWDIDRNKPSRTIAILRAAWLRAPEVRTACEAYGVLENFRADFGTRGIYFASYYDIRSAQYASVELQSVLQRMLVLQRSSDEVIVRYCLSLNSSSQFDESQILLTGLPSDVNENIIASMLSSYGALRSLYRRSPGSYVVEFQSVQDAKQALLELESSQPLGPGVNVEMGVRNPIERKSGRELLAMLSRWRHGMGNRQQQQGGTQIPASADGGGGYSNDPWHQDGMASATPIMGQVDLGGFGGGNGGFGMQNRQQPTPQLVLGPDGRYQVVMAAAATPSPYGRGGGQFDQRQQQQQIVQGPNGQLYVTAVPMQHQFMPQNIRMPGDYGNPVVANMPFGNVRGVPMSAPYYTHIITNETGSHAGSMSGRSYGSGRSDGDKDNRHLMLDLDAVEAGEDTRTSLMVRNIPNKYTQQMLLSEFQENGHGPGVIDFFYLPIDFKNRCNRGYAFINFVDYKDILAFHRLYFGKHWRTFNSDKICDITYARIQGKAAMLKRFENSALMEKDDEYKPLVFVSDGPNKGQRLPFPGPAAKGP